MSVSVGTIVGYLELRDRMTQQLAQASVSLKNFGDRTSRIGEQVQQLGTRMTMAFTVPLAAAGIASVKFASEFQTTMTRVGNITNIGVDGIGEMREKILELAPAVGIGPNALAQALYTVASTGLTGASALSVLEASAKASAIGLGETRDIARAVTSAMMAYGESNLSAEESLSKLFVAVREGGAEAEGFAGTLGRIVGIAANVGVSFDEVVASVATFTRLGVNAAEAVTALRGTLSAILDPSKEGQRQLLALGSSIEELKRSIREKGLAQALVDLVQLTKGNDDALRDIIPNVRALAGVLGTAGAQADAYKQILKNVQNASTEASEAFKVMSETVGFKWNVALAQAQVILIKFGDTIGPIFVDALRAMQPLVDALGRLADWFAQLPSPVKTAAVAFAALVAAMGPLMFGAGTFILMASHVAKLSSAFIGGGGFATVVASGATAVTNLGAAAKASSLLMGVFTASLIGIAVPIALTLLVKEFEKLREHQRWVADAQLKMADASKVAGHAVTSLTEAETVLNAEMRRLEEVAKRGGDAMQGGVVVAFNQAVAAGNNVTVTLNKATGQFNVLAAAVKKTADAVGHAGPASLAATLEAATRAMEALAPAMRAQIEAGTRLGKTEEEIAQATGVKVEVVGLYLEQLKASDERLERYLEHQADLYDAEWKLIAAEIEKRKQLKATDDLYKFLATQAGQTRNAMFEAGARIPLPPDLAMDKGPWNLNTWKGARDAQEVFFSSFNKNVGESFGKAPKIGFFGGLKSGFSDFMKGMTGGKGFGGLMSNLGDSLVQGFGNMLSGGLSSLVKMGVGLLGKGIAKLFGADRKETEKMRGKWLEGIDLGELQAQAERAGVSLDAIFNARKPKDFERAVKDVEKQMKAFEKQQQRLAENAKAFAAAFKDVLGEVAGGGRLASKELLGVIERVRDAGGMTAEIAAFQRSGLDAATKGLVTWLTTSADAYKTVGELEGDLGKARKELADFDKNLGKDKLKTLEQVSRKEFDLAQLRLRLEKASGNERARTLQDIKEKEEDLARLRGTLTDVDITQRQRIIDKIKELTNAIATQRGVIDATAITTQDAATAASAAILAVFAELQRGGVSVVDAMKMLQPAITALDEQMRRAGLTGNVAFAQIAAMAQLSTDKIAGPALNAVSGLNQVLVGLHNTGLLNQDMFAGLAGQVGQTFDKLVKQGFDGNTVMRMMQPTLQTIWELMQDFGFKTDETTEKLIAQAVQAGIVGDKHRDANERIAKGIENLITLLEDFLKKLADDTPKAAETAVDAVNVAGDELDPWTPPWDDWSDPHFTARVTWPDPPSWVGGGDGGGGGDGSGDAGDRWSAERREAFIRNNGVEDLGRWDGFAEGGIVTGPTRALIGEAGPEAVVPLDRFGEFGEFERGDRGDILMELREINRALLNMPRAWRRAMREAQQQGW